MSEFTCQQGHLLRSGQLVCDECGEPLYAMDGMTNAELRRQEQDDAGPLDDDTPDYEDRNRY